MSRLTIFYFPKDDDYYGGGEVTHENANRETQENPNTLCILEDAPLESVEIRYDHGVFPKYEDFSERPMVEWTEDVKKIFHSIFYCYVGSDGRG